MSNFNPLSENFVRGLQYRQRDMLVAHVDGAVPIKVAESHVAATRYSLVRLGLLRYTDRSVRPRATELTEVGRQALGILLGVYADALVKAGFGPDTLLEALHRLRVPGAGNEAVSPDPASVPI